LNLTDIALDDAANVEPAVRHLAAVLLHQYVDVHWSSASAKFAKPEPSDEVKHCIRSALPRGLSDADSKVRTSVAFAIASIAVWDWPIRWPELVNLLVDYSHANAGFGEFFSCPC
jgi:hypothetical protein